MEFLIQQSLVNRFSFE